MDVSKYQGTAIDWRAAAAANIKFAIARASIGGTADLTYAAHVKGMREAGIQPGAYHYLWPGDGAAQADFYLATIGDPDGLLTVVDVEAGTRLGHPGAFDEVNAFAHQFKAKAPHHTLILYTGGWFWRGHIGNPHGAGFGPLWDSRYIGPVETPEATLKRVPASWWEPGYGGWPHATFLQFTDHDKVPGFTHPIDVDAFNGDAAALLKLATTAHPAAKPAAKKKETPKPHA